MSFRVSSDDSDPTHLFFGEGEMRPVRRFPWAATGAAASSRFLLLVLASQLNHICIAQSPNAAGLSHPFDVKTGLWDVTTHTSTVFDLTLPAETLQQLKAKLPPDQYAKTVASLKASREKMSADAAKETTQKSTACLTPASLQQGAIFIPIDCLKGMTSSSRSLNVQMSCQNGQLEQNVQYERTDPEHIHASAKLTSKGTPPYVIKRTIVANWTSAVCGSRADQLRPRALALGANPTVLDFLPYNLPGDEGYLGRTFTYYWYNGPTAGIPEIAYRGGIPGERPNSSYRTYFHGTDGSYLYVTLVADGSLCAGKPYRLDKAGNATQVPEIPRGLKGGEDEFRGGPPCNARKVH